MKDDPGMQYSPKLKNAMEQIKKILVDNDIAGFVVLHTPGFSEYLNHVQTSYSCAVREGGGIRLRLKQAEIGKEKAKQLAEGTYNMFSIMTDVIALNAPLYFDMKDHLKAKWGGEDGEGYHTGDTQQNT